MSDRKCERCGASFGRAIYGGKKECRKSFEKRKFCCDACRRAHDNEKSRAYYAANKEKIRARKSVMMREYRSADPEKFSRQSRHRNARQREQLFEMYGHKCSACGFDDKRALTLDHILGNGAKERREFGERGVYRRALEKRRASEYRILCMNCQFISRHNHDWSNRIEPAVVARAWTELAA